MPKIRCTCDEVISLSEIPNPYEYLLISDNDFESIYSDVISADLFYEKSRIVVKCPDCGRLHIFWDGFDKPGVVYKVDLD